MNTHELYVLIAKAETKISAKTKREILTLLQIDINTQDIENHGTKTE